MTLQGLLKQFSDYKCNKVYVKQLSPNDNSKNQVYLGESFDVLNILPTKDVVSDASGQWKNIRFKSKLDFYWLDEEGALNVAPDAQLILYPRYPEVRFSGFLKGVKNAPSALMSRRIGRRLLFFGITTGGQVIGYVVAPETAIANEIESIKDLEQVGIFKEITLKNGQIQLNSRQTLIAEMGRIHLLGWINSRRLDSLGKTQPCKAQNCGGYTLEAELGITPNSYSEPDYLGWEIKQFNVRQFTKWQSSVITLMTPEPTGGYYVTEGIEPFIRKYGYSDKKGRTGRMNFGGIHKFDALQKTTNLTLIVKGYDYSTSEITDTDGYIGIIDRDGNVAASWDFASMLKHWNRKHANACYVPSMNQKEKKDGVLIGQQYCYGANILLGEGTDFALVLKQIAEGKVYYDPGIKLEFEIPGLSKQVIKRRSQFRIKSAYLSAIYKSIEIVDVTTASYQ